MRTLRLRIISFILIFSLCISLWSPANIRVVEAEGVKVMTTTMNVIGTEGEQTAEYSVILVDEEGQKISDEEFVLLPEEEISLIPQLIDAEGTGVSDVAFTYVSSDVEEEAITITETGLITAKKVDASKEVTVTIKGAYLDQIYEKTITVRVNVGPIESITIEKNQKDIVVGETYKLADDVVIEPENAMGTLTYSSSNEKVATVDANGVVTAVGFDETLDENNKDIATITVSAGENVEDTITIKVIDVPASIKLNKDSHSMKATDTFQIEATIVYKSGKEVPVSANELEFSSGNEAIATVDENGLVTGKIQASYPTETNILVSHDFTYEIDGEMKAGIITEQCKITVTKIPVESIALKNTETAVTMKINDTFTLEPVVAPENATDKTWEVKNSDKDAVSAKIVDDKVVLKAKAMAKEPVTITIYAKEDSSIKVTFTVNLYQTEFNVVELGVNATDTKSDSGDLNDILWYATCIEEPITVIFPDGNYYIDKTLKVYTKTNIVLSDNAVIIRKESAGNNAMLVNRTDGKTNGYGQCRDITITGGTWDGNANGEADANCLYFGHAQNITITNTKIINNSGAHLIEFAGVKNALVEDVELYGYKMCNGSEFKKAGGNNAVKEAIQMDVCGSNASAMTPWDGTPCDTITIRNCKIHDYMSGIGTHTGASKTYSKNVRIENNEFNNITNACIGLIDFNNVSVTGNKATNCTTFLYASRSQGVIKSNKVNNGTSFQPKTNSNLHPKNGITISNGSSFIVEKNTFEKAKSNGVCVWNGSTATINNNKIKNNKLYGIRTQGSTITLKKNTFSKNKKGQYDTYKDAKVKSSDDIRAYYIDIKKSYKYKGKAVKPKIKIKNLNKKYYKVTYKNNKKPGTATVTIKGKGKVKQTLKIKYKIKK